MPERSGPRNCGQSEARARGTRNTDRAAADRDRRCMLASEGIRDEAPAVGQAARPGLVGAIRLRAVYPPPRAVTTGPPMVGRRFFSAGGRGTLGWGRPIRE